MQVNHVFHRGYKSGASRHSQCHRFSNNPVSATPNSDGAAPGARQPQRADLKTAAAESCPEHQTPASAGQAEINLISLAQGGTTVAGRVLSPDTLSGVLPKVGLSPRSLTSLSDGGLNVARSIGNSCALTVTGSDVHGGQPKTAPVDIPAATQPVGEANTKALPMAAEAPATTIVLPTPVADATVITGSAVAAPPPDVPLQSLGAGDPPGNSASSIEPAAEGTAAAVAAAGHAVPGGATKGIAAAAPFVPISALGSLPTDNTSRQVAVGPVLVAGSPALVAAMPMPAIVARPLAAIAAGDFLPAGNQTPAVLPVSILAPSTATDNKRDPGEIPVMAATNAIIRGTLAITLPIGQPIVPGSNVPFLQPTAIVSSTGGFTTDGAATVIPAVPDTQAIVSKALLGASLVPLAATPFESPAILPVSALTQATDSVVSGRPGAWLPEAESTKATIASQPIVTALNSPATTPADSLSFLPQNVLSPITNIAEPRQEAILPEPAASRATVISALLKAAAPSAPEGMPRSSTPVLSISALAPAMSIDTSSGTYLPQPASVQASITGPLKAALLLASAGAPSDSPPSLPIATLAPTYSRDNPVACAGNYVADSSTAIYSSLTFPSPAVAPVSGDSIKAGTDSGTVTGQLAAASSGLACEALFATAAKGRPYSLAQNLPWLVGVGDSPAAAGIQTPQAAYKSTIFGGIQWSLAKTSLNGSSPITGLIGYQSTTLASGLPSRLSFWLSEAQRQKPVQTQALAASDALGRMLGHQPAQNATVPAVVAIARSPGGAAHSAQDFRLVSLRSAEAVRALQLTISTATEVAQLGKDRSPVAAPAMVTAAAGLTADAKVSALSSPATLGQLISGALSGADRNARSSEAPIGALVDRTDQGQIATMRTPSDNRLWTETEKTHGESNVDLTQRAGRRGIAGKSTGVSDKDEKLDEEDEDVRRLAIKGVAGTKATTPDPNNNGQGTNDPANKNDDEDGKPSGKSAQVQGTGSNDSADIDQGHLGALIKELRGRSPGTAPDKQTDGQGDSGRRILERRSRYQVQQGDTLDTIAQKQLGSRKAAPLILQINKRILKTNAQGTAVLTAGAWITLPSKAECLRFIVMVEIKQQARLLFHTEAAAQNSNKYICRLGDTLASIAQRHPQLGDRRLWVLLARVNNLSEKTDRSGRPLCGLKRGQLLTIPGAGQARAYLAGLAEPELFVVAPTAKPFDVVCPDPKSWQDDDIPAAELSDVNTLVEQTPPSTNDAQPADQSLINTQRYGSRPSDLENVPQANAGGSTIIPPGARTNGALHNPTDVPPAGVHSRQVGMQQPIYVQPPGAAPEDVSALNYVAISNNQQQLVAAPEARVVTQSNLGEQTDTLYMALQVNVNDDWFPVVQYRVQGGQSSISIHTRSGRQRTILIDLPTRAARELAENDLAAHARSYCLLYLADRMPF